MQHIVRIERKGSESMTTYEGGEAFLHSEVSKVIFGLPVLTVSPRANIAVINGGGNEKEIVGGDPARITQRIHAF